MAAGSMLARMVTDADWQMLVTSPVGGRLSQGGAFGRFSRSTPVRTGQSALRPGDAEQLLEFPGKVIHPLADFRRLFEQRG